MKGLSCIKNDLGEIMGNKEFIDFLMKHPKSKVKVTDEYMQIYIRFKDLGGKDLPPEKINEEIENAKFYLSVFSHYKHGLFIAWDYLQNYIENIEGWEKNPSRRYQLLKYGISKLVDEYENIIDERTIDKFYYDFVKESGKMSLKTRPWTEEEALIRKALRYAENRSGVQDILDKLED